MINRISFEEVCSRVFRGEYWGRRLLLGCLLSFLPIINLFTLGYLYRYGLQVRRSGNCELPPWDSWGELFIDGLRMLVILLLYMGSVIGVSALIAFLVTLLSLGLLGAVASFLWILAVFVSPMLFAAALYRYQEAERWSSLLDVEGIVRYASRSWPRWWVPAALFTGLVILGMPLYGAAFFLGLLLIIAYATLLYYYLDHYS